MAWAAGAMAASQPPPRMDAIQRAPDAPRLPPRPMRPSFPRLCALRPLRTAPSPRRSDAAPGGAPSENRTAIASYFAATPRDNEFLARLGRIDLRSRYEGENPRVLRRQSPRRRTWRSEREDQEEAGLRDGALRRAVAVFFREVFLRPPVLREPA